MAKLIILINFVYHSPAAVLGLGGRGDAGGGAGRVVEPAKFKTKISMV